MRWHRSEGVTDKARGGRECDRTSPGDLAGAIADGCCRYDEVTQVLDGVIHMAEVNRDYIQSSIEMFDARIQVMDRRMESLIEKIEALTDHMGRLTEAVTATQHEIQQTQQILRENHAQTCNLLQQQGQQQLTLLSQLDTTIKQQGQQQATLLSQLDSTIKQQGQQQHSLMQQQLSIIQALITGRMNAEAS